MVGQLLTVIWPGLSASQQIAQLELLCQQFYESTDIAVRSEAEKALVSFSESPESLPQCQVILERSQVRLFSVASCAVACRPLNINPLSISTVYRLPSAPTSPQSPYALLLAASTLTKLVTRSTTSLTVQDRLQLSELGRELI